MSLCCSYDRRGGRADIDNAVTNCVFLFSSPLVSPLSSLHRCPLPPFHLHSQPFRHSVSHPLGVEGPLIRKVNWLCCVFRRLHNDDGTGGIEVIIFSIFSGHPPAHPLLFSHNVKCFLPRVLCLCGVRIKQTFHNGAHFHGQRH